MSSPDTKTSSKLKVAAHPVYSEMISFALTTLKERNGSSRQAIAKFVKGNYTVGDTADVHIKMALKRMVASGVLVQTKGVGASGSFKLNKVQPKKTEKKPAKKPATKKDSAPKTGDAKKVTRKVPVKKSPTKKAPTKKPAAKKSPAKKVTRKTAAKSKKPSSPKKVTKKSTPKKDTAKK